MNSRELLIEKIKNLLLEEPFKLGFEIGVYDTEEKTDKSYAKVGFIGRKAKRIEENESN